MRSRARGLEEYDNVLRELLEDGELVAGGNDHLVQLRVVVGVDDGHPPAGLQHRLETILGAAAGRHRGPSGAAAGRS